MLISAEQLQKTLLFQRYFCVGGTIDSNLSNSTVPQIDRNHHRYSTMTTAFKKAHRYHITQGVVGFVRAVRTLGLLGKQRQDIPALSEQTRRTFEAISAPANARHFTKSAALKAFAHVKI